MTAREAVLWCTESACHGLAWKQGTQASSALYTGTQLFHFCYDGAVTTSPTPTDTHQPGPHALSRTEIRPTPLRFVAENSGLAAWSRRRLDFGVISAALLDSI